MQHRARNFRIDTVDLLKIVPREALIACFIVGIPTYLFGKTPQGLDTIVSALLANEALIKYAFWTLPVFLLLPIVRRCFRSNTDERNACFDRLYNVMMEASSSLWAILRAGSGVAMGILALSIETTPALTSAHYKTLCGMLLCCCLVSSALSFYKANADRHLYRSRYQNPLLLRIK
ncbi:hypothetical protein ACSMEV_11605 [Pseudomonas sp. MLB6B]